MSYQHYQYVLGLLSVSSLFITSTGMWNELLSSIPSLLSVAAANFIQTPHSPLYVVRGETAKLVWTYRVDDKIKDFSPFSPEWFYMENQIRHLIGRDNGFIGWKFQIATYSCPPRLLSPTVRVSRQDQATLVIQNTTMNDTGIYGCELDLITVNDITSTVELIATETPTFVVKPNAITAVVENSDLRLTCSAVGTPTPNVTWVHSVNKSTITQGKGSAVLYLSKIKRNLNGHRYQCQAINNPSQGPVTIATTVVVYYPPTIDKSLSSMNITSWNGNNITLRCKYSSGQPAPTWKWYRPNGQRITANVQSIADGSEVTVMTGQYSSDYGLYKCMAINVVGSQRHTISIIQIFLPGSPKVFVTDKESTSVTIRWTQPVYNGGSPIIAYRIVIDSKTFHLNDTSTMFYTVTDLSPNTQYVVNVSSRSLAGYSNSSSVTFTTRGQQSCTCGQDGGRAGVAVSVTFLVILLMANILFVLYIYRTKRKTREPTEQGYDNKTVQMDSVKSSVTMPQSSHPSVVYEPVEMDHSEQARQKQLDSQRKPKTAPTRRTNIPKQPTIYANAIPENDQSSQDYYQQLNPATLQHDPTVQYEPLRIKHATGTDLRNDTYEPLRNRPSQYQSLQKPSNVDNTSFS